MEPSPDPRAHNQQDGGLSAGPPFLGIQPASLAYSGQVPLLSWDKRCPLPQQEVDDHQGRSPSPSWESTRSELAHWQLREGTSSSLCSPRTFVLVAKIGLDGTAKEPTAASLQEPGCPGYLAGAPGRR